MNLRKTIHSLAHILRGVTRFCGDLSSLTTEKGFRLGVNCELVQNGLDTLESTVVFPVGVRGVIISGRDTTTRRALPIDDDERTRAREARRAAALVSVGVAAPCRCVKRSLACSRASASQCQPAVSDRHLRAHRGGIPVLS